MHALFPFAPFSMSFIVHTERESCSMAYRMSAFSCLLVCRGARECSSPSCANLQLTHLGRHRGSSGSSNLAVRFRDSSFRLLFDWRRVTVRAGQGPGAQRSGAQYRAARRPTSLSDPRLPPKKRYKETAVVQQSAALPTSSELGARSLDVRVALLEL